MAWAVGNARPRHPSSAEPGAGSPRRPTSAVIILVVRAQEQFVVHTIRTTSSNTLGLRIIRPAPRATHASWGSPRAMA